MAKALEFDGPIPGENYTSDIKNYPWHRPPEFTTSDEALEYVAKIFNKEEAIASTVTMLEMGIDIATVTDLFITKGISEGKWSVDLGILIAGPVAHIFAIMAKTFNVPVRLGLASKLNSPTSIVFDTIKKDMKKTSKKEKDTLEKEIKEVVENKKTKTGFMQGSVVQEDMDIDKKEEVST